MRKSVKKSREVVKKSVPDKMFPNKDDIVPAFTNYNDGYTVNRIDIHELLKAQKMRIFMIDYEESSDIKDWIKNTNKEILAHDEDRHPYAAYKGLIDIRRNYEKNLHLSQYAEKFENSHGHMPKIMTINVTIPIGDAGGRGMNVKILV